MGVEIEYTLHTSIGSTVKYVSTEDNVDQADYDALLGTHPGRVNFPIYWGLNSIITFTHNYLRYWEQGGMFIQTDFPIVANTFPSYCMLSEH